jgi:8-oxo-dGTP pyrophosphatase MutT (NUDIX family)
VTAAGRSHIAELVALIDPFDAIEAEHRRRVLDWIDSGAPLHRVRKPDHPPQHLVAYFVVTDPATGTVLLVDHINAGLWLPPDGHVEPDEHPAETASREAREELGMVGADVDERPVFVTRHRDCRDRRRTHRRQPLVPRQLSPRPTAHPGPQRPRRRGVVRRCAASARRTPRCR